MTTTAIILSGAGARGAYEAGALSVLLPWLAADLAAGDDIVVLGTSAGAINAVLLASSPTIEEAAAACVSFWHDLDTGRVINPFWFTAPVDAARYAAEVLRLPVQLRSLLDSGALRRTLCCRVPWPRLHANLNGAGWVHRVGTVATEVASGTSVVFVEGPGGVPPPDVASGISYVGASIATEHVLASSAIPVVFRPINVRAPTEAAGWYVDGGTRLNTPISPALALGADRVAIVGTTPDPDDRSRLSGRGRARPPDVFDTAGSVLTGLLVDRLAADVHTLRAINSGISAGVGWSNREGSPYRHIPNLYVGPACAQAISQLANEVFRRRYGWRRALSQLGLLGDLIGGSAFAHGDLLSFVFVDKEFLRALVAMGQADSTALLKSGTPYWSRAPSTGRALYTRPA